MREPHVQGVATHDDPEPCIGVREDAGEAWDRGMCGPGMEPRNHAAQGALFAQLPKSATAYSPNCPMPGGGPHPTAPMQTVWIYDRGLERVTEQSAPSNGVAPHIGMMRYDGFGRIVEVDQPMVGFAGAADTANPALTVQYNDSAPIRQILRTRSDGPATAPVTTLHYQYIDGFGDTIANLDQVGPLSQ